MSLRYEVFEDKAGQFRWRAIAGNGEVVSTGEAYTRRADCYRSVYTLSPGENTDIRDVDE